MESNIKIELVKLAKEKGFVSQYVGSKPYFPKESWLMSESEDLRWFLWMCELQKWLIDKKKMYLWVEKEPCSIVINKFYFQCPELNDIKSKLNHWGQTYEQTLMKGLFEILKII